MSAVLHIVQSSLNTVTVATICKKMERGNHALVVLERVFNIPGDTEINEALTRLSNMALNEQKKQDARHWSFSHNRLVALKQHHQSLSQAFLLRSAA